MKKVLLTLQEFIAEEQILMQMQGREYHSIQDVAGKCTKEYEDGLSLINSFTAKEKELCARIYQYRADISENYFIDGRSLVVTILDGRAVIIPRQYDLIEKVRAYRKIFSEVGDE